MVPTGRRHERELPRVRSLDGERYPDPGFIATLKRALSLTALGIVLAAAGLWLVGSILSLPFNHTVTRPPDFDAQDVAIPGGGHAIAAWWIDAGPGTSAVLLLHGVHDDRTAMIGRAKLLGKHGFSALLIDLQGHGETPGEAITFGYRESSDVTAALTWLRSASGAPRKLAIIGCSMGGAATLLAQQPTGADALVLEAVFPRITRATENRLRMRIGPLAPALTPLLLWQLPWHLHISASDLEPIRHIANVAAPVLIVAGSRDEHTTLEESLELYAAAPEPKSLWIVEGAKHQDFLAFDPKSYEATVVPFLQKYLREQVNPAQR